MLQHEYVYECAHIPAEHINEILKPMTGHSKEHILLPTLVLVSTHDHHMIWPNTRIFTQFICVP